MCCSMMLRRICRTAKWMSTVSLPLVCVTYLLAADMKRVSPDEMMKAVAFKTKPEYSPIAKQLKLSGAVGLDVVIAEDGRVETITVLSGNPVLAKLATDAVKRWTFFPFKVEGKAVKVVSEVVIRFNYEG
jgi:TonB family protein